MWILLVLFQSLLLSHSSHWLVSPTFPCKPNFAAISAFKYVCVLPSSNRIKILIIKIYYQTFTPIFHWLAVPAIKYIPAFDPKWNTSQLLTFCCHKCILLFLPSHERSFNWHSEFCSNSYSWLALCNIILHLFKQPSIMQAEPHLHSLALWPSSKQQKHNSWIYTVSHLCCLLIFLNVSYCQTLYFFPQILQYSRAVLAYVHQPDCLFVSWNP